MVITMNNYSQLFGAGDQTLTHEIPDHAIIHLVNRVSLARWPGTEYSNL